MAMPGGRQDPGDHSLQHAAEREAFEEVGVDLRRHGRLLGRLDDIGAIGRGERLGLTIGVFVYAVEADPTLRPNYEVQETHWVPLSDLIGPEYRTTRTYDTGGARLLFPAWRINDRVIWGLTYNMLESLLRVAK